MFTQKNLMVFPKFYKFIFTFFFLFLIIFQIQRIILLISNGELLPEDSFSEILFALFNRGLLFDIYICSYFSTVPFLILGLLSLFFPKEKYKYVFTFFKLFYYSLLIFSISVLVSDIVYYKFYSIRLTKTILEWASDLNSVLPIITADRNYLISTIIVIIATIIILLFINPKINRIINKDSTGSPIYLRIPTFLILLFLLILGIRGTYKFHKMPLTKIDAYFSEDPLLNQASFNPIYTFIDSFNKFKLEYFKETDEAIKYASQILESDINNPISPIYRKIEGDQKPNKNVVLILVESLSKNTLSLHNKELRTTPFIDSLTTKSLYFENIYSANTHTHGGIYSTLFSYPLSVQEHALNSVETSNLNYFGLSTFFKKYNYQNQFFLGGDKTFDNMNSFLLNNSFDKVISDTDFNPKMKKHIWGFGDELLLDKTIEYADMHYNDSIPFFQSILTASTHKGNIVNDSINNKQYHQKSPYNMYENFDRILKEYFNKIENKPWFDETVFVIIGDHGQVFNPIYDMPLSYHKVPLLIYSKTDIQPKSISDLGMQIDVFPTIAGLFNSPYPNNTLGIDLLKKKRDYAYFCSDSKLGIIDHNHFLIYNSSKNMALYNFNKKSQKNLKDKFPEKVDSMLKYIFSMLQTKDYLLSSQKSDLTKVQKK